uniref:Uncharacterized protein n=1 Tax=Anguilla anguilla TaxID=7936 RepID=A0A0E9TZ70_ANGAN
MEKEQELDWSRDPGTLQGNLPEMSGNGNIEIKSWLPGRE